jgi:hypothetical protein
MNEVIEFESRPASWLVTSRRCENRRTICRHETPHSCRYGNSIERTRISSLLFGTGRVRSGSWPHWGRSGCFRALKRTSPMSGYYPQHNDLPQAYEPMVSLSSLEMKRARSLRTTVGISCMILTAGAAFYAFLDNSLLDRVGSYWPCRPRLRVPRSNVSRARTQLILRR